MNPFQRYLLDEFVEDYRGGEMSRRDFVMKMIGVSGGLAAAMGFFYSVGLSNAGNAAAPTEPRGAPGGALPVANSAASPVILGTDVSVPPIDGAHEPPGSAWGRGWVGRTTDQNPPAAGAGPFSGRPPPLDSLAHTHAAALGLYGELDTGTPGSAPAVQETLQTAGVPHDFKIYP